MRNQTVIWSPVTFLIVIFSIGAARAEPLDPNCRFDFDEEGGITKDDLNLCFGPFPPFVTKVLNFSTIFMEGPR